MNRSKTSSSRGSSGSSCESTFSRASHQTYQSDLTSYSQRPVTKQHTTATSHKQTLSPKINSFYDGGFGQSTSSVVTYASTQASDEDPSLLLLDDFPRRRRQCFDPDAVPTTPADFAELFPTSQRIMIQHDDSSSDGNMNLRVDMDVRTKSGRKTKMTLFHLKMKDLAERQFSLRRYCRNSGREVASSKRQYVKSLSNGAGQPPTTLAFKRPITQRQDSGYQSEDDDEDELEKSLQAFTLTDGIKATIPTSGIRLEFSNYAQVIVEPQINGDKKQYDFEYWGEYYSWRRRALRDRDELVTSYELMNLQSLSKVASIVPDALSVEEAEFETTQGAWIPASSMRLLQKDVSHDLGDVIIATGLIALTDDCIPR